MKLHKNLVITNEEWAFGPEWRQEWIFRKKQLHRLRPKKYLKKKRKKFGLIKFSIMKNPMPLSLLLDLKSFKKYYNLQYILARGSKEINLEEMDAAGYIKEYSQTGFRWRFKERRSQKKYLPWLQILIANRNLYLFQNYNALRRKKPKHVTKKKSGVQNLYYGNPPSIPKNKIKTEQARWQ